MLDSNHERNHILAALSEEEHAYIAPYFKKVRLQARQILVQGEQYVYFPIEGIVSTMVIMSNGSGVEVMLTGSEGCVEVESVMAGYMPATQTTVHVTGNALRIPASIIHKALFVDNHFSRVLQTYMQKRFMQVAQLAACNRLHGAEQRLARWLLTMKDRLNSSIFPITHEVLGHVLGTKRSTISEIAHSLQRDHMIRYSHGMIRLLDTRLLEQMTCECYFRIRDFSR